MKRAVQIAVPNHRIYGLIDFGSNDDSKPRWREIGSAVRNSDGSFDLSFNIWPSNMLRVQIRKEDALFEMAPVGLE